MRDYIEGAFSVLLFLAVAYLVVYGIIAFFK